MSRYTKQLEEQGQERLCAPTAAEDTAREPTLTATQGPPQGFVMIHKWERAFDSVKAAIRGLDRSWVHGRVDKEMSKKLIGKLAFVSDDKDYYEVNDLNAIAVQMPVHMEGRLSTTLCGRHLATVRRSGHGVSHVPVEVTCQGCIGSEKFPEVEE